MSTGERWVSFEELTSMDRGLMKMAHERGGPVHFDGCQWSVRDRRVIDESGRAGRWFALVPTRTDGDGDGRT